MRFIVHAQHKVGHSTEQDNNQISDKNTPHAITVPCKQSEQEGKQPFSKLLLLPVDFSLEDLRMIGETSSIFVKSLILECHYKLTIGSDSHLVDLPLL